MIRLENFSIINDSKQYLLKDVNLFIPSGSVISISGKKGSGKTSLYNTIGLKNKQSKGNIFLLGKKIDKLDRNEISNIHKEIGKVDQESRFLDEFNVEFNIKVPLIIKNEKKKDINIALKELLPWLSLEKIVKKDINQISYSEKKVVQFARAIISRPRILLLDDFFLNIDPQIEKKINYLILALNRIGTSIIVFGALSKNNTIKFDKRYNISNINLTELET